MSFGLRTKLLKSIAPMAERLESRRLLSAGPLDPSFGAAGYAYGALFPGGSATAVALQTDGRIVVAGTVYTDTGEEFAIARLQANGQLDRTFGVNGRVITNLGDSADAVTAIALQHDGKIVVGGVENYRTVANPHFVLARYLPDGTRDKTFGVGGTAAVTMLGVDQLNALVIEPSGRIVAGGASAKDNVSPTEFALAGFTAAGTLDKTFGVGGKVLTKIGTISASINGLGLQGNGDLVAAGNAGSGNGIDPAFALARYLPNGVLDTHFGVKGVAVSSVLGEADNVAIQSDGKIVAAGETEEDGGPFSDLPTSSLQVARFNADGTLDRSFGNNGAQIGYGESENNAFASGVSIQKGGDIVVGGTSFLVQYGPGSQSTFMLNRFLPNGQPDQTYGGSFTLGSFDDYGDSGAATAAAGVLQPDGKFILVGAASVDSVAPEFAISRFTLAGHLDDSFGYHGTVQHPDGLTGPIEAVAVQADGKIVVAGSELGGDGKPTDAALARYNANGSLDTTFGIDGKVILRIGNNAAYDALAIESNGDIVVGGLGNPGGANEFAVVRYLPSGAGDGSFGAGGEVLTSFAGAGSAMCSAIAVQSNGDIIAVGSAGNQIAAVRYLPGGKLDSQYGAGGKVLLNPSGFGAAASGAALQKDGKLVIAGGISDKNAVSDFAALRLTTAGRLDTTFGNKGIVATSFLAGENAQANALVIDSAGRLILGGYTFFDTPDSDVDELALARYLPSGVLDPSFGVGGKQTFGYPNDEGYGDRAEIDSLALQSDGKIVAGCNFFGFGFEGGLPTTSAIHPFLGGPPPAQLAVVARFTASGLDPTFGDGGLFSSIGNDVGPVNAVAVDKAGKILAGDSDLFRV